MSYAYKKNSGRGNYDQNDGVPGVVYILQNEAFKESWIKIGCTRYSGHVRAADMNKQASIGLPAHHICVFEYRTDDCGRAEKLVHQVLAEYRKGRQEFFEIDINIAKSVIIEKCNYFNKKTTGSAGGYKNQRSQLNVERERVDIFNVNSDSKNTENEEALNSAKLDLTCPGCKTALIVSLAIAEITHQKIRCPSCKLIFSASQGFYNEKSAQYENICSQTLVESLGIDASADFEEKRKAEENRKNMLERRRKRHMAREEARKELENKKAREEEVQRDFENEKIRKDERQKKFNREREEVLKAVAAKQSEVAYNIFAAT